MAPPPRDDVTDILLPEIASLTFTPGTWRSGTTSIVAGATAILDGQGDPNSVFLFQSITTMLMVLKEAKAKNVAGISVLPSPLERYHF
jgi:hypothetical protein